MATKNVAEIILQAKDQASQDLEKVNSGLSGMAKGAAIAAAAFVAFKGVQALVSGVANTLKAATKDALDNIEANQRLEASLRAIGQLNAESMIQDTAMAFQRQGIMAASAATKLGAYIVNLTGAADKTPQLMRASIDLAAALGVNVETAAQQLSRTLSGEMAPRLAQVLPELKNLTKEQLLAGEAINFVAEAFKGQANDVMTARDRIDAIKTSFGDMRAQLVQATLENENFNLALDVVNQTINDLIGSFSKNVDVGDVLSKVIVKLMTGTAGLIEASVNLVEIVPKVEDGFKKWYRGISILNPGILLLELGIRGAVAVLPEAEEATSELGKTMLNTAATIRENAAALDANINANIAARESGEDKEKTDDKIIKTTRRVTLAIKDQTKAIEEARKKEQERQAKELQDTQTHVLTLEDIRRNAQINRIEEDRARQEAHFAWQSQRLEWQLEQELITRTEYRRLGEQLEAEHQERLVDIEIEAANKKQLHQERMIEEREQERKKRVAAIEELAQREREIEISKNQELISLGGQLGSVMMSQREGSFRHAISILASEAGAHAAKWIAETVPPPFSFALAPAAGIAMGALISSLGSRSYHTGGIIGQYGGGGSNQMINAQVGEAVINRQAVQRMGAGAVEAMNAGTSSSSGGVVVNLTTLDAATCEMELREGGRLNRAMKNAFRRGDIYERSHYSYRK